MSKPRSMRSSPAGPRQTAGSSTRPPVALPLSPTTPPNGSLKAPGTFISSPFTPTTKAEAWVLRSSSRSRTAFEKELFGSF